jgi:hypothetical protein
MIVPGNSLAATFPGPGTFTYTVPPNVTKLTVELWGGGGAGGYDAEPTALCNRHGGGGGGSGAYLRAVLNVTPGQSFTAIVGNRGFTTGEDVSGGNGSSTSFVSNTINLVANGGQGGQAAATNPTFGPCSSDGSGGAGGSSVSIVPPIVSSQPGAPGSRGLTTGSGAGGTGFQNIGNGGQGGYTSLPQSALVGQTTITETINNPPSVKAVLLSNPIHIGDPVQIDVVLENPNLASGGGVNALEAKCSFTPAIMQGNVVTPSAQLFTPDPAIINQGFQGNQILYAVSQSGNHPPVTTNGIVFSMTLTALQAGQTTLNCAIKAIDGMRAEIAIAFAPLTISVENPVSQTGTIQGTVHYSHKSGGGITITVLNGTTTIATATTLPNETFTVPDVPLGTYTIRAEAPGYMPAEGSVTVLLQTTVTKPTVTLLAGDLVTSAPDVIDELDVVQLAIGYGQSVPPAALSADLNGDNVVGLADLNALAVNLRKTGPISWN